MRKLLLIAGVAAFAIPGLAAAQPGCVQQQHDNRVAGTVFGAGLGAIFGSTIAGPGNRGAGAVLGAVGGGALGNVAGGASVNCDRVSQNGYYDSDGVWHGQQGYYDNGGAWHMASGYYNTSGAWVEGVNPAPPPTPAEGVPSAGEYGADVAYVGPAGDVQGRESWLSGRIQTGEDAGTITHFAADTDRGRLAGIQDLEGKLRADHDGLSGDDRADLNARLDDLSAAVSSQWRAPD
jgi:hypothetical protein